MVDFLDYMIQDVKKTIEEGYYNVQSNGRRIQKSLKDSIIKCKKVPIIAEIKPASPKKGVLIEEIDVKEMAIAMERGGAVGISVLTEPKHFKGSLEILSIVREAVDLPILMKDFIISPVQIEAADKIGANAILLIKSIFDRKLSERNLDEMIEIAKSKGIEVLLEVHNEAEFLSSIRTEADMIGINNRDLVTLNVNLEATKRILSKIGNEGRIIVSESGISTLDDVKILRNSGAHAFLIGTAIMTANDFEAKVREFVEAI
ncbi:MAG: indole-3-glycerol-phosphate synthase [archaeon]|nr:indole-3-glycerol-phosphate synthase [archaeon]MCP8315570.1 indole-3-glycerol-phosphate synthase [archaeon]MCP8319583.1 indole-3-glycerol-phosphate synthase [archaeon]